MASNVVAVLSVVGVLGTAGAAMAVNADTLAGAPDSALGNATSVLVPSGESAPDDEANSSEAPTPGGSATPTVKRIVVVPGATVPSPTQEVPADAPAADNGGAESPVDGTTGGSSYSEDDDDDDEDENADDDDDDDDEDREVNDDSVDDEDDE